MNTAEQERAAIVAYLRRCQAIHERWSKSKSTSRGAHNYHAQACKYTADAIENGEHCFANQETEQNI